SSSDRSPIRGLRSGSGRLAGIFLAGCAKPIKFLYYSISRIHRISSRFRLSLVGVFALVRVDFPPTQPSLQVQFAQPTPDALIRDRRDAIWGSGAKNCRDHEKADPRIQLGRACLQLFLEMLTQRVPANDREAGLSLVETPGSPAII